MMSEFYEKPVADSKQERRNRPDMKNGTKEKTSQVKSTNGKTRQDKTEQKKTSQVK
jgi:hypothetical protein